MCRDRSICFDDVRCTSCPLPFLPLVHCGRGLGWPCYQRYHVLPTASVRHLHPNHRGFFLRSVTHIAIDRRLLLAPRIQDGGGSGGGDVFSPARWRCTRHVDDLLAQRSLSLSALYTQQCRPLPRQPLLLPPPPQVRYNAHLRSNTNNFLINDINVRLFMPQTISVPCYIQINEV